MTQYVFMPPAQLSLPIQNEPMRLPVRRIYCVGRNYAEHAREMGADPTREAPFFFSKPADALVVADAAVAYPPLTADLHFEGELVVALGKGGRDISPAQAGSHIFGFAIGNDLTRRDAQAEAKSLRRPWDLAKGFDGSAVVGPLHRMQALPPDARLTSRVNGEIRQEAALSSMIWPVSDIIAFLSQVITLAPGDLIMTGTPAGVGPLERGDLCRIEIDGLGAIETRIV